LEYMGRIDTQVKIRGYRVELGAIETALRHHNKIKDALVLTRKDETEDDLLIAYLLSDSEMSASELRIFLQTSLPNYMIPMHFVHLDKFPLTRNGKLDKVALLDMTDMLSTGVTYVAPRNSIESKLVEIWEKVLHKDKIGIHDSFFDLGGHSVATIKALFEINQFFDLDIQIADVFHYTTIEEISAFINIAIKEKSLSSKKEQLKELEL